MASSPFVQLYRVDITTCCKINRPAVAYRRSDLKNDCDIGLFRELMSFDDVKDGDYIFPTSRAFVQCEATTLRNILVERNKKINDTQKAIDEYDILFKFSQCYNHFGQTIVLDRVKENNPNDNQIRGWRYWKNCTQYLSNFDNRDRERKALQDQIYAIVKEYGIDRNTWNAIFRLNKRRNDQVHVPITETDAIWLKNNASQYEQFERDSRGSNFVNAVTKLADALRWPNRQNRYVPQYRSSLEQYLDSNR